MKKIFAILATAVLMLTILTLSVSADGGVPGIEVEKTVWDNEKAAWEDEVRADVGEIVEFKSTIHNSGSCDLTTIEVTDILSDSFEFEDATPEPNGTVHNQDGTTTLTWFLPGPLAADETREFLINAKVTKCGVDTNTQSATAEGCGETVSDEDTATVNVPGNPGIEVTKTVWDGAAWVDEITANLGDTVRFNSAIKNIGTCGDLIGADLTNIVVTDTLPKSLEYTSATPEPDEVTHPDGTTVLKWFLPGPLAADNTETFLIDATVRECVDTITNTQNATAECCGETVSDEDTATVNVEGVPGLEVVKTVWDGAAWVDSITANLDDIVEFNLTVHNSGTCCNLTDIWVIDELSDSFEYISSKGDIPGPDEVDYSSKGGKEGGKELKWFFSGPLAPCETITYMITARVTKCGVAENKADANATAECTGQKITADQDIATVTVPGVPGMKVEKTVKNENDAWVDEITANVGALVEFNSTIKNIGTCCDLTNIEVTDILSDSFDFVIAIPAPKNTIHNPDGTTTLTWFLTVPLVPGETQEFLINATVTKCGVDTNTMNATAESCEKTVSDEDTATVNVPGVPGIEVTKTVWNETEEAWEDRITANLGDTVRFNSTIKNSATGADLTNIVVTDTLPESLEYTSAIPEPDEVTHPDGTTVLKWFLPGPLAADNTETFLIDATVRECVDTITNTQNATAECCGETVSDEDTATVNVEEVPGLEVVKTVWDGAAWVDTITANLDDIVEFNLTVHNNGTCCNLTDIWVIDELSDSFEYISSKGDTPGPDKVDYSSKGGKELKWFFSGPLAPCETRTYMITARVTKCGVAENKADADATAECTGQEITADQDIATVTVPGVPGMKVEKTVKNENDAWVDEITANVGALVEFNSTIKNIGTYCDLTNIEVTDILSDSFDFEDATPEPNGTVKNPDGTTTLTWFWDPILKPGETQEFLINATVTKCGVDTNTMNATAESCEKTVSDEDTATVIVPGDPGIEVNKTVWDGTAWVDTITANLNDIVQFKATIHNSGTCCNLTDIEVTDTLSRSLEYISAIPEPDGRIDKPDGTTELIWILTGLLVPGETQEFLINATVTECGVDTNTLNATAESCEETVSDEDDAHVNVSPLPDLVISEKSETIVGDELFNITYTVANIGCADAGPTNTTIEIDTWTPIEVLTPAIAKGESYTNTVGPYNCPCGETLTISVCADNDNVIVESNETNNCKENELECPVCPLKPDLVITDEWLCWPDTCTICYNVTNIGEGTAHACHNTTLYVDSVAVAHDHVPVDLAPGESYSGCFDDYIWAYTTPSDNITVCADNNETVNELDEDNNCLTNIWMCGDVNGDGKVTMSDVRKMFNRCLDPNYPLELPWAADVNCDGEVTMSDVRKVFNRCLDPGYELNCCCKVVD